MLRADHVALFSSTDLQVWVRNWPGDRVVFIWLNGPSVCLNDQDVHSNGYHLNPHTHMVSNTSEPTPAEGRSTSPLNPSKPNSPERVIQMVVDDVARHRGADPGFVFNHLVLSCHALALQDRSTGLYRAFLGLGHDWDYWRGRPRDERHGFNMGFSAYNLHLFARLKGMFRYIWIQGCTVGNDLDFLEELADHTGAIVTGYLWETPQYSPKDVKMKPDHIDFPHFSKPRHVAGKMKRVFSENFFWGARHTAAPDLRESLYFNIVETRPAATGCAASSPAETPRAPPAVRLIVVRSRSP